MSTALHHQIAWPPSGRYILAVSGGVDSVALLDLLATHPQTAQWRLEVAHFNHGWRGDDAYEAATREVVKGYNLPLHVGRGHTDRNEAAARAARYDYLRKLRHSLGATAIITAHHLDDLEETVVLNLLRGTGRRGLTPFTASDVVRPLVGVRKQQLRQYAIHRKLSWCHDTYNDDLHFRRNQVRHQLLPKLRVSNPTFDEDLAAILEEAARLNRTIDRQLKPLYVKKGSKAQAQRVAMRQLDPDVLTELLLAMSLAVQPGAELDRRTLEQLAVDLKTGRFGASRSLTKRLSAVPARDTVTIVFTP